jgi:predicted permease
LLPYFAGLSGFCIAKLFPDETVAIFDSAVRQHCLSGHSDSPNAYGTDILPVAAIISSVYIFWLLTLGLILVEVHGNQKFNLKRVVLSLLANPLLISVFVGISIVAFGITLPTIFRQNCMAFSDSVTAVVLFSLGIFLGIQNFGKPREWIQVAIFVPLL